MNKKPTEPTKTTEFEVEGIEEAYRPSPAHKPGQPFKGVELPKLQVDRPPELRDPGEHTARIWILERRARGIWAKIRRWFVGQARK